MSLTMNDGSDSLRVCELFRSIAGETTRAGRPATFIRLAGCNLRCNWCDTQKAWEEGSLLALKDAIEILSSTPDKLVIVTGGEPLLQAGTLELCRKLDISQLDEAVGIILDIKPPSSGQQDEMDFDNIIRLKPGDELKIVVADREDFDWACEVIDMHKPVESVNILFSPASDLLDPKKLAEWILNAGKEIRMQLQLHKIIWPNEPEGFQILDESADCE
ncbi:MAG: 4Fe-4S cluster-binding domain-containing protein [Deltaproteobacteria bacterium]|nr:4Fe-4S cluster-binding domain-containing protein [Deltaproteobacteria bacterium]